MRRLVLIAALLAASVAGAQADNDIYRNVLKQPRSDTELHADGANCDQQYGAPKNGVPTSRQYKRCMANSGWRFQKTQHIPAPKTWIDPETGLTCRDLKMGDAVIGSSCSNF
jgi:hypothetical protein